MFHIVPALIVCNSHKPVFTSTLSSARRPGEETWVWHVTNDVVVSFPDPRTCNHGNETYCPKQNRCAPFRNPRVVKGLDLIYLTFVNMVSHCINNNSFLIEVIEFFLSHEMCAKVLTFFFPFPRTLYMQPQNEYIEQSRKRHGYRLDHFEKKYVLSCTIELLVVLFCDSGFKCPSIIHSNH